MKNSFLNKEYKNLIVELKSTIKARQLKAAVSVNSQLILLYFELGAKISSSQSKSKWGTGFIEQISKDLRSSFAGVGGFSAKNLRYCKAFFELYSNNKIWQQLVADLEKIEPKAIWQQAVAKIDNESKPNLLVPIVALIPWGHNIFIMQKIKSPNEMLFYIQQTINNNWSRAVLEYQIETGLYKRQGKAITNFKNTMPQPDSDLAIQLLKDPYNFDFLSLTENVKELELETKLVEHITQFLLELGKGFAYLGRQFLLNVGGKEFRTDLLFYHIQLRSYIIIDLKMKEFEPEFAGKMNFYITAINETVKTNTDKPTLGILLCKDKNDIVVDFALKDINKPIGVSTFTYNELPKEIKKGLPSLKQWKDEINKVENE